MKNCITLLVLFVALSSYGQNFKFGKVSKEELQEKVHPLDSTADAAYLYAKRRSYFDYSQNDGFRIITEVHERIKIYSKDGFDQATKKISYYNPGTNKNREQVKSIEAITFNLEGSKISKTKTSKKEIFDESVSASYGQKKVTFPNVKEGSVLEFKYKLISPHITVIDPLSFQKDIPVKKLYYTVEVPEYFNFKARSKGYYFLSPQSKKINGSILWGDGSKLDYQVLVDDYRADNIPPLKEDEVFVNNINDYRGGVSYEINWIQYPRSNVEYFSTTWEDVSKSIYSIIGPELNRSNYYKNDLTSLLQGVTDNGEKLVKIFQFVKEKVKWDGNYGTVPYNSLKKVYKEGTGNVGSINLMMISMLRTAGLDANPVLVSSKSNGTPLFPTRTGFNYVVAAVTFPDGYVLLDASETYSLPNMLPPRALNWKGRLIKKNGSSTWLNLEAGSKDTEDDFISVKIDADGMVEGMMRTKYGNLGALNYRNKKNSLKEDALISEIEDDHGIEVEEYKIANKYDLGKPVTRTVKFSSEDLVEEINGKMYIKPMLFKGYTTNPFKSDKREFPIEFNSPWKEKSTVNIQLPEGYTIESSPESKAMALPEQMGMFKYQVMSQGSKVRIVSLLEFNIDKIPASYYDILKGFFTEFVEKQSEKIVLIKS
jgi:hypothetical protein